MKTEGAHLPFRRVVGVLVLCSCLTGCTAAGASASRSVTSSASSTDTSVDGLETSLSTTVTVPAGGSIEVPLAFEGSGRAVISVFTPSSDIGATFGGTALTADSSGLSADLSNPVDGSLHISNSGSQSETVGVVVMIQTGRVLTITPSVTTAAKGQTVSLDVVLTQAVGGDAVQAELVDPSGTHTPIPLTEVGNGHWTGQVIPTMGGTNTINAWTTGDQTRQAQTTIEVTGGNVVIPGGFTERLNDSNGDGLADQLILTVPVTVVKSGVYQARARLADSSGTTVALSHDQPVSLSAGSGTISLTFKGADIYTSGRSGPYRVLDLLVDSQFGTAQQVLEARVPDLGLTKSYDYHAFNH